MERLRERNFAPGSLEAEASELLRATEPYAIPAGLKRRVRERLLEGRPKRWRLVLLRPALVAVCSLLAVGALAAVGRSVLAPSARPTPVVRVHAAPAMPVLTAQQEAPPATPALAPPTANDPLSSERAAPLAPAAPAETRRGAAERSEHAAEPEAPSEAALVYGAAKALRNNGDAALAAKLLDDHARRYGHGALAEEALALSIDVSVARGDGRAKELATRYLARYPSGHFRAKAERVLAR